MVQEGQMRSQECSVFNLNISKLKIYEIDDPELIDMYETALSFEINENKISAQSLISFLYKYPIFAQYGFFKGFGHLLYSMIVTDHRLGSDIWIAQVFLRVFSLHVKDPDFCKLADQLILKNSERLMKYS